jgi:hypothetical protein
MNEELTYAEKSKLPLKVWVFIIGMSISIYLAIWAPLGVVPALFMTLLFFAGFLAVLNKMQTRVFISKDYLYANNAKIEIKYIKKAIPLNKSEFRDLNGVSANPAAFLATNFWTNTGVKIELKDKNDPTPYWLISSKRANEIAEKLN